MPLRQEIYRAYTGCFFTNYDTFTALRFTATGAPPATKHMLILLMTRQADNIWDEGNTVPLFTDHRCWKRCPSALK
jgi:hypothetical protein